MKDTAGSEEMFRTLVENLPDLVCRLDREFRTVYVNPVVTAVTGFLSQRCIGLTFAELGMPSGGVDQWNNALRTVFATGEKQNVLLELAGTDGLRQLSALLLPERDMDSEIVSILGIMRDVTSHLSEMQKDRKTEQMYRLLIETVDEGIWVRDQSGTTTFVNPRMAEILGYSPEQMIGRVLLDFLEPGVRQKTQERFNRRLDGEGERYETTLVRKDGARIFVHISAAPLLDDGGRTSGAIAAITDITEIKRTEEAYRLLVDNSLEGFAIIQDGRIVFCNEVLTKASGYSRAETYAMSVEEIVATVHPEDRPLVTKAMEEILTLGKQFPSQPIRMINKNGQVRWVEVRATRADYDSRPALQVAYLDITDRYEAEKLLRRSEERLRTLIEKEPVAIGISREGKRVYANRAYLSMFGLEGNEEIEGKLVTEQVAPSFREEVLARALRRASGAPAESKFELMGLRKDGSQFPCGVEATMLDLGDGPATLAFFSDRTAINEAERKLKDSQSRLRNLSTHLLHAREEERKRVAREIHDDLGQTLTALKMDLQWIEKRIPSGLSRVQDKMHEAVELVDHTIHIVQKIAAELRPGLLDELGLAAAIQWLAADFSRRMGIPCSASVQVHESHIEGNSAIALFRVVQEALTNIARHAHASRASVSLTESEGTLQVSIHDDGVGITEQQSEAHTSLGLIGIRERVEWLGGKMSISGKPGRGTTLNLSIPLQPQEART